MGVLFLLLVQDHKNDTPEGKMILVFFFLMILLMVLVRFTEPLYAYIFKKPFYVHFYPFPRRLNYERLFILQTKFSFYQRLPEKQKSYFEHRVAVFIAKYRFIGKEGLVVSEEMKVLIAATSTMLTFGMRQYLYRFFDKIIIFPTRYYSTSKGEYHKGEFNPAVKAIVFSWEDFVEGYLYENDNLNLGLHEFTHALHFQGLRSNDISAVIFADMCAKIIEEVKHEPNRNRLLASGYFRNYAFTNEFEFLAVILEYFFETPETFKQYFPELYSNVKKMINFKEHY